MKQNARKFDCNSVLRNTERAREYAESLMARALSYSLDSDRKKRHERLECKACFYVKGSRIGGAAMTTKPCDCCGKDVGYGSTCTDAVCRDCAKKHALCLYCGGDVDMRDRRSRGDDGRLP